MPPTRQALHTVRSCRSLLASDGWAFLSSALKTRLAELTAEVMDNDLPPEARETRIHEYRTLREWLRYPETQLAASLALLEAAGGAADADGEGAGNEGRRIQ